MATKTSVLITAENTADLADFIKTSAGRTKAPSVAQIIAASVDAEKRLEDAGVPKTKRVNCRYRYRDAGPWANAYKYKKAVVSFTLHRKREGWVIVEAVGETVYPKSPEADYLLLTPDAKAAVVKAALEPFGFLAPKKKAA